MPQLAGVGDLVLVGNPPTFRVLPWAPGTGWMLCDAYFPDGSRAAFDTRNILGTSLDRLAAQGFSMTVGVELEFHVFRSDQTVLEHDRVGQPGAPGRAATVRPITPGAQLLHEEGLDLLDEVIAGLHRGLEALDLPVRSLELEFGASQLEMTLAPTEALFAADHVLLARSAIRQLCRRQGAARDVHVPAGGGRVGLDRMASAPVPAPPAVGGSCIRTHRSAFSTSADRPALAGRVVAPRPSSCGVHHPDCQRLQAVSPASLAPDRIVWGLDNKGTMVRVIGGTQDPDTRLENRSGEPAANPYLYVASQVISGLDGIGARRDPGPPTDDPYAANAPQLPRNLMAALDALETSEVFTAALGRDVVEWFLAIKRGEVDRYLSDVSDWEQREYFGLF